SLGEWEEGRKHFEQSLNIARELGDRVQEGLALVNFASALLEVNEPSKAEELLKKALGVAKVTGHRSIEQAAFQTLGNVYGDEGRLSEAENAYHMSWQIASELGDPVGMWKTLYNLSVLRELQGDLDGAQDFMRRSIEILKKIKGKELDSVLSLYADLERKAKEQEEAQKQPA